MNNIPKINNYLEETRPALTLASLNVRNDHSTHPLLYRDPNMTSPLVAIDA